MKKIKSSTLLRYLVNLVLVVALFLLINTLIDNGAISRYYYRILYKAIIFVIAAVSLNLTCGFLGQLPLGHAGFMAIGAYTSAIITTSLHKAGVLIGGSETATFLVALLAGALLAGVFGILIGLPALRLKGDYLAIITLAFGEMIRVFILNVPFTGGALGIKSIPRYTNFAWVYWCCVLTIFVVYTLIHSKAGRAIISIRENEIAAESCGVNTTYYKSLAFTLAAFFAGLAGGLFAHYIATIVPSDFDFSASIDILVMVVLGGMGSIMGSVISATALTALPEVLRAFSSYRMVVYSLLLVIVMIFKPSGLMGKYEFSLGNTVDGIVNKIRKPRKAAAKEEEKQ